MIITGLRRISAVAFAAMAIGLPALVSLAGELQMQSNLVRDDFSSGTNWLTPKAWNAIPKFETEAPGDATAEGHNWFYTQVAHNKDWFFVRYHQTAGFAGDLQYTLFDTDSNDETGWLGPNSTLASGADRVPSGASLKHARRTLSRPVAALTAVYDGVTIGTFFFWQTRPPAIDRLDATSSRIANPPSRSMSCWTLLVASWLVDLSSS